MIGPLIPDDKTGDSSGSAKVTANAKSKAMRGIGIPVTSGQKLAISVFAKWSGFTGGVLPGDIPIQLQLVTYKKQSDNTYKETGIQTIASINPAGATNLWTEMAATYAVPVNVDQIRPRLFITEGRLLELFGLTKQAVSKLVKFSKRGSMVWQMPLVM